MNSAAASKCLADSSGREWRCSNVWLTRFNLACWKNTHACIYCLLKKCSKDFNWSPLFFSIFFSILCTECRQSCYNTVAMLSSSQHTRGRYNSRPTPSSSRLLFSYSYLSLLFWSQCELFSNWSEINNKDIWIHWRGSRAWHFWYNNS